MFNEFRLILVVVKQWLSCSPKYLYSFVTKLPNYGIYYVNIIINEAIYFNIEIDSI